MEIRVIGFKKTAKAELESAAAFFADLLLDPRMSKNIVLDIERNMKLDVEGECVNEDMTKNSRWFTVTLRGGKQDEDPIKTLAHEMVHVKQYAKNELYRPARVTKGKPSDSVFWKGATWSPSKKEDAYWDSPWEVEAYGREIGLYQRWLNFQNNR